MAPAIRLTGSSERDRAIKHPRVAVLGAGAFADAVVERLITLGIDSRAVGQDPAAWVAEACVVLSIADGHADRRHEALDDAMQASGTAWVRVALLHDVLEVGPVVIPGSSPCYGCYQSRALQHSEHAALAAAIRDADPGAGGGFLSQHVRVAAGLAHSVLTDPGPFAGLIWTVHLTRKFR